MAAMCWFNSNLNSGTTRVGWALRCAGLGVLLCIACDQPPENPAKYKSEVRDALIDAVNSTAGGDNDAESERLEQSPITNKRAIRREFPPHLIKNRTLLVLASEPDVRALYLVNNIRDFLTPEQFVKAEDIAYSYNDDYRALLHERAQILENAVDGDDVHGKIIDIYERTVELNRTAINEIKQKVLTKEQRKLVAQRYEEYLRAEEARKASQTSKKSSGN